jgi:hypothetical protein
VRFFASQELAGGEYVWHRFQGAGDYEPYLLTCSGSVFLLEPEPGEEEAAAQCLRHWEERGLPLPGWARTQYARGGRSADLWSTCPYVPENGYGEVVLDRAIHWEAQPRVEDFRGLDGDATGEAR